MPDRLKKLLEQQSESGVQHDSTLNMPPEDTFVVVSDAKEEALSALLALGYKAPQASKVINSVYSEGMKSEDLIRESLRSMVWVVRLQLDITV